MNSWVNVGLVGRTAVLTASGAKHIYYDEEKKAWCDRPDLDDILSQSPFWITRVFKDNSGTLWGTHHKGVVKFTPTSQGYKVDAASFDLVNDQFPNLQIVDGTEVWASTGGALYHFDSDPDFTPQSTSPVLVVVRENSNGAERLHIPASPSPPLTLPYDHNSPEFLFFSRSYAAPGPARLVYRLNGTGGWAPFDSGSFLRLNEMREGAHALEVRNAPYDAPPGPSTRIAFQILAPWHRTWDAYILYATGILGLIAGAIALSRHQMRAHNRQLERMVGDRTRELEATMVKLSEETRNSAVFAERNRLAGEIHDSLQQGLSGVMLQLDSTLKMPEMPPEIRFRLSVAREMVSFTRREVQHVVWDLGTPLLNGAELHDALQKMSTFLAAGKVPIDLTVSGEPGPLSSTCKHHLLRIAQEAITNSIRHAAAQHIHIMLHYGATEVSLTVEDDGVGFAASPKSDEEFGHFGLRGMHDRAVKFGGALSVRSVPGRGTTVRVTAPRQSIL